MQKSNNPAILECGMVKIRMTRTCNACGKTHPTGSEMVRKKVKGRVLHVIFECKECHESGRGIKGTLFKVGDRQGAQVFLRVVLQGREFDKGVRT